MTAQGVTDSPILSQIIVNVLGKPIPTYPHSSLTNYLWRGVEVQWIQNGPLSPLVTKFMTCFGGLIFVYLSREDPF